jgi:DNA polymerase III alpha subunit
MTPKEKLSLICNEALRIANLDTDQCYVVRLAEELREIDAQNEFDYFLDLSSRKVRYSTNQNNLLTPYLLGVVQDFDIAKTPEYTYGEFPDIDIDYIDVIRDYLKNDWAPKKFGPDKVCNIGNYATFGIKSAFQDMARVHSESRSEILDLTTKLGLKDDEGKALTYAKALEIYPELKKYCEDHPDVAKSVQKLLHRNRGMGKHAGGLIIANVSLDKFVPLVKNVKDDTISSAWVEGLHAQDLGPVGLIKFDLLVIKDLQRIAIAANLVRKRKNLPALWALPGLSDWSDRSYKNDKKAIQMANAGDLLCVFQFDSEQIRAMVRRGGVQNFDDLVAYNALYRPGPLGQKMHERYIERKRGREEYSIHPIMEPYLSKTYGVLVYQEQIMQILHAVGDIPLKDCYIVIKAVAKKKVKLFKPYKEQFLTVGKNKLGWTDKEINDLWNQIESFAEYGFNKSHATAYVYISCRCLALKAHYPLEFYAATLQCEGLQAKIKEYKTEAEMHGVKVHPICLNKSKERFDIVDEEIYFGYLNVKGIGEAVSKRIVAGQPYTGFQDFLERFGTDASVVKPLVALRVFGDAEPVILYKFYEFYRDRAKKQGDRRKRFVKAQEAQHEKLRGLVPESMKDQAKFDSAYFEELYEYLNDEAAAKELRKLWNQHQRSIKGNETKTALEEQNRASLVGFNADEWPLPDDLIEELRDAKKCEELYYGFPWRTRLEESPDYCGGHTFATFKAEVEAGTTVFSVEVEVREVQTKNSKKNKDFVYHQLITTDANGQTGYITVWKEDFERWKPEMAVGNLLKIRITPPSAKYKTYTFESPLKHLRHTLPKDKRQDMRLVVMRQPEVAEERKHLTDSEILDQMGRCKMEE